MKHLLSSISFIRKMSLAASILLGLTFLSGCSDGADGADGAMGPAGYTLLLESTDVSLETCWGLGERRIYGYDTTDDGVIDDVVLEEVLCELSPPDERLYGRNILYYQDGSPNQFLETLQQLSTQGIFRLFHTTDLNEFEAKLENGWVDVVVFLNQSLPISSDTENLLADWVSNEGRLIFRPTMTHQQLYQQPSKLNLLKVKTLKKQASLVDTLAGN